MQTFSLFPDYAVFESGRTEAQAMRLAQQLREVDLQVLATDAERRMVISRLRREGIDNVMQLVLLTQDRVMGWYNVGPVFLSILSLMRDEVVGAPERIVARWHNEHRLLVLPDDLQLSQPEDDFFGMLMAADDECAAAIPAEVPPVLQLERCLVAAIEMIERRWEHGVVLRRYFLDGLPVETIVGGCRLASSASLFRIVDKQFAAPLLRGYQVKGIQFSSSLLRTIKALQKELLYKSSAALECLERITPVRFLHFLDLVLLQRTTAENFWGGDFIVREGEIEWCRRTQRDLFSVLQFRVVAAKENAIRHALHRINVPFFRVLLHEHPCIEEHRKGYRLVGECLTYECARLARLVYDAHTPIALPELLARYERQYLERPQTVSISHVRARFPQVHSVRRGVWEWK